MDAKLKRELEEIAELLRLFPDGLQQQVFDLALAGRGPQQKNVARGGGGVSAAKNQEAGGSDGVSPAKTTKSARRKGTSATSHTLVTDLDFSGVGDRPAFVAFVDDKSPESDADFNTLAVYYLSRYLSVSEIGQDHVYTCYKTAKRKVPTNMPQSLRNTHSRTGAIEYDRGPKNIRLTTIGENVVEHDLPRAAKAQKS